MAYHPRRRQTYSRPTNPKLRFYITVIVIGAILYATIFWILPFFVNSVGLVTGIFKTTPKAKQVSEEVTLAPPVFNIPFEETSSTPIEIKGFATPNAKVQLYLDEHLGDEVTAFSDGSFTFENVELVLGTNNIYGKTLDDKNKESLPSKTIIVIYDNEKPPLEITEPEDGKQVQGERKLAFSGKTEVEAKIFLNDSQIIVKSDGTFATQVSLNDGDNQFNIKAVDKAGNFTEVSRKVFFQP